MIRTDTSNARESIISPQFLHREAAVELEIALKHHRQAASFHDIGDASQGETEGGLAYSHTAYALEVSGRALNVLLW